MLVNRVLVSNRLCLSIKGTYRVFPATLSNLLSTEEVIERLNEARMNNQPRIEGDFIPQLQDSSRLAEELGITPRRVRGWTQKDRLHACPHFRLTDEEGHEVKYLFDPLAVEQWASCYKKSVMR